eukprot:TCALIF_09884-PA protein Name:"Protein of unknown function" AED:0.12 eAED:0.12 QI:0/0/0.5/0.5/0/0.5/2/247/132
MTGFHFIYNKIVIVEEFRSQLMNLTADILNEIEPTNQGEINFKDVVCQKLASIYGKQCTSIENSLKVTLLDNKMVTVFVTVMELDSMPDVLNVPLNRQFIEPLRKHDASVTHSFVIIFCPKQNFRCVFHISN